MNKIIVVALIAFCFSSCADTSPEQDPSLYVKDTAKITETTSNTSQSNMPADAATLQAPPGQGAVVTQTPQQVVNQVTANTAPGMNPPHGQPGHRCDIAVGAPLNSAPAKPATPTTAPVVTQTATPKTVTAPGMNPPHGEPGHRCDIAVGAPLNSAPAKQAVQTAAPVVTPVTTPVELPKKDS